MSRFGAAVRLGLVSILGLALVGCDRAQQQENASAAARTPARSAITAGVTPMAERVAVLGVLNKRNGIVRDVAMRPGQSARWKDLVVRLRACEKTAPWENERLTGSFVQVDVQRPDKSWGRVFSGWLYKESPSLNVVEHPVYDVWIKSCEMTFPAGQAVPSSSVSSRASSASNSGGGRLAEPAPATPAPAPAPEPSTPVAAASNAI
jgi:hypothetical protein